MIDPFPGDRSRHVGDCPVCCTPVVVFVDLEEASDGDVSARVSSQPE